MSDATRVLEAAARGDPHAAAELLPLVYDELRRLAAARLVHEQQGQTLDATSLVHEAYVRLVGERRGLSPPEDRRDQPGGSPEFANRAHFFSAAAEAMRRILIDRARARNTQKRGGDRQRIELDEVAAAEPEVELLELNDALTELESHDPKAAQLVKLRYFAGLSHQDAADALSLTRRQADRVWTLARAWLYQQLQKD
jgi:RNA polymerase sigma factor (TIGR02999 family)